MAKRAVELCVLGVRVNGVNSSLVTQVEYIDTAGVFIYRVDVEVPIDFTESAVQLEQKVSNAIKAVGASVGDGSFGTLTSGDIVMFNRRRG